jgi:hypothetical protein
MQKNVVLSFVALLSFLTAALLGGCGSGNKEGVAFPVVGPRMVGSQTCINCHTGVLPVDVTGDVIVTAWQGTTHTTDGNVQCENCHGGGGNHFGLGPMPFPNPQAAQCTVCHGTIENGTPGRALAEFNATDHANGNNTPNAAFTQIATPVSAGQHIQECSVCHNPSQRFAFDPSGNLVTPSPTDLPRPVVSCASCHDGHQPQLKVAIAQRTSRVGYPLFRAFYVNASGAQDNPANPGVSNLAAFIFQPNGAALPPTGSAPGTETTPDFTKVVGTNNEINPDRLCAACHTKGNYRNSGGVTHQDDIHTQWTNSGHGERTAAPFGEFAANPTAYDPAFPTGAGSHQSVYPFDMSLGESRGATARPGRNAAVAGTSPGSFNNNYQCYKCHNGLTSRAWQDNVQGTASAPVVYGDATVTCVTCHDPHRNTAGNSANTRKPVIMTRYSSALVSFSGNVFLDNSPIPDTMENATICVYCHQGRESGFTLYKNKLAPTVPLATLNRAFFNPHYLGTGAMLWGVNGYEYTGKSYSANTAHQNANCTTCHMDNPTADNLNGGHTWSPNVASCNTSSCHSTGGVSPAVATTGTASPNVNAYRAAFDTNDYDGNGFIEPIAVEIQGLQTKLIELLAMNGIYYDDLNYPYVFNDPVLRTTAAQFTTWGSVQGGTNAYKAAFNLQYIIKGLPSSSSSQTLVPNASAAVHDYKYTIQLLRDSYEDYYAAAPNKPLIPLGGVRPAGTRPARVYGVGQ